MSTALQRKNDENHEFAPKASRGTSLNIKNAETTRMVRELAALKGVSLVAAVSEAVKEDLDKEKAKQEQASGPRKSRYDLLMEFADLCSERIKNPIHSWEIDALLYDEDGLPK